MKASRTIYIAIMLLLLSLTATLSSLSIPHIIYDNSELRDLRYGWPVTFIVQDSSRYSLGGGTAHPCRMYGELRHLGKIRQPFFPRHFSSMYFFGVASFGFWVG